MSAPVLPLKELAPVRPACPQCGRVHPGGRFMRGCSGPAIKDGRRSKYVERGLLLPPGAPRPAEREQAILADLGDVTTLQAGLVRRYVHAELVAEWLEGNLLASGVLTSKGKQRAAVTAYLGVVDRLVRLGSTLGLERRPKALGTLDAVRAAVERERERA